MHMIRGWNNGCGPAVSVHSHCPPPLVDSAQNYVHTRGAQAVPVVVLVGPSQEMDVTQLVEHVSW